MDDTPIVPLLECGMVASRRYRATESGGSMRTHDERIARTGGGTTTTDAGPGPAPAQAPSCGITGAPTSAEGAVWRGTT